MKPLTRAPRRPQGLCDGRPRDPRLTLAVAAVSVILLGHTALAADVISDGMLTNSAWTVQLSASGFGGSGASSHVPSGGNLGAMRRVQVAVAAAPNCCTQSMLWVATVRIGYSYAPGTRGALGSISVSMDCNALTPAPEPMRVGPVVRQDGLLFVAVGTNTGTQLGWHGVACGPYTQNDFVLLDPSDTVDGVEETLHPNFGPTGSPIEMGFYGALASGPGGGLRSSDHGIDNVVITVSPAAQCAGDFNTDGAVNTADLTALLARFGQAVTPGGPGDMNADGAVNTQDLTAFLSRFGTAC